MTTRDNKFYNDPINSDDRRKERLYHLERKVDRLSKTKSKQGKTESKTVYINTGGGRTSTPLIALADNTATSITPPNAQGFLLWRKEGGADGGVLIAYDAVSTPLIVLIAGTAMMAVTTGALAGTTGTDGKFTISAHSDGKIYFENRTGGTINSAYLFL